MFILVLFNVHCQIYRVIN
uniref:Uncharacterized protein n=1 Tax=Arundo donax TaxID=35708 RepID=A0A0A8Z3E7_ARUDO